MKKIYYMMLLASLSMAMASCSGWDSPYHVEDVVGSWVSEYGCDGYGEYDILGYDAVRFEFFSNYTGRYTYFDYYGQRWELGFYWETRGDRLFINYDDGDWENLYYGFDKYGYLILSTDRYFYQYTAYRPGGFYYYEPAKEMPGTDSSKSDKAGTAERATVKVKTVSKALKARDESAQ